MSRTHHQLRRGVAAGLLLVAVGAAGACKPTPRKQAAQDGNESFTIPPPRPPRSGISQAEAALAYATIEKVDRDPFLTSNEEASYDGRPVEEAAPPPPPPPAQARVGRLPRSRPDVDRKAVVAVIQRLKAEVKGIIIGSRNTFVFEGKLYEEGDKLPGDTWVVTSITESGIRLKTVDGSQTDFLKFKTDAALEFHFDKTP